MKFSPLRAAAVLLLAAGTLAATAGSASAAVLSTGAADCTSAPSAKVFSPWLDPADYFLSPGGDFESGAKGWTLSGGARVVADQEPWNVGGTKGGSALELPAGSKAVSPVVCMGLDEPTVRMFARTTGVLQTSATVVTSLGIRLTLPIGVDTGSAWAPGLAQAVVLNTTGLGQKVPVQLVLSSSGGTSRVDDVYVDPWRAR